MYVLGTRGDCGLHAGQMEARGFGVWWLDVAGAHLLSGRFVLGMFFSVHRVRVTCYMLSKESSVTRFRF